MMTDSLTPDVIYHGGKIYTADKQDSFCEAIAIAQGFITATGSSDALLKLAGSHTEVIDLEGRVVLPGLIDSHMHPFWGGKQLRGCNLNYAALTVEQTLALIQTHLDADPLQDPDDWLSVRAWQRQGMVPAGADMSRDLLDTLNTRRPVVLFSNDCHTLAANSRALAMLGIDENTPVPADGKIGRDDSGRLNGILEDAPAMRAFDSIPTGTPEQCVLIARHVQKVLNQQGVTTVMDTRIYDEQLIAFAALRDSGELTLRMCGAREITPDSVDGPQDAARAVEEIVAFNQRWNDPQWTAAPGFGLSHVKFFVDGVLQPPTMTASLLRPYRKNVGTHAAPDWQQSDSCGDLYFSTDVFNALIDECGRRGVHPHMHTVGDGAIEVTLDALAQMRQRYPGKDVRPGLAHNELAAAHQYARFAELDATAVLSYQWAGLPGVLISEEREMLGEDRFPHLEPQGRFLDAGARLAYGSDWPIDRLDEWYNLQVAMTRRAWDADGQPAGPRLDNDRNLTLIEVLRSATIDAAFMIARDREVGSLEPGKLADLIVLHDDIFTRPPETLFRTRVLRTVVGGKTVWLDAST